MTDINIIDRLQNMGPSDLLKSETKKQITDYLRPQYMATNDTPDDYITIYTIISDAMVGKGALKRQAESMLTKLNTELLREARTAQKTVLQAQERAEKIKEKASKKGLETVSLQTLDAEASPFDITLQSDMGNYKISRNGVFKIEDSYGIRICRTPVIIDAQYDNPKTGASRYRIKYGENKAGEFTVKERIVSGAEISDSRKLINLSDYGLGVNANNAGEIVQYLDAFLGNNSQVIPRILTTGKMGWLNMDSKIDAESDADKDVFDIDTPIVPYSDSYDFDGTAQALYDAAKSVKGDKETYITRMCDIRKMGRSEINLSCAAALASILLKPLKVPSYVFDLYGRSTFGKTLSYIIAMSQYGDPSESGLQGAWSSTSTDNGIMARLSILNNLPVWLDDSSGLKDDKAQKMIQPLIYALSHGTGGDKSNKNLGLTEQKTWRCVILSNGEEKLTRFVHTAGAQVRCLEVKVGDAELFDADTAADVANFFLTNHGHVIRDFLAAIRDAGIDYLMTLKTEYMKEIKRLVPDIHSKQIAPLAIMLVADKIATDYIYKDGIYLADDIGTWADMLAKKQDVDVMQGAYDAIMDILAGNPDRLHIKDGEGYDQWGYQDAVTGNYFVTYEAFKKIVGMTDIVDVDILRSWMRERDKLVLLPETYRDKSGNIHTRSDKQRDLKPTFVNGSIRNIGMLEIKNRTQYDSTQYDDTDIPQNTTAEHNPFAPLVPPVMTYIDEYQSAVQAQAYADKHAITDIDAYLNQMDDVPQEYLEYLVRTAC